MLGYGSGGTVVFAGELDGRPVAVKRMLRQFYEMARKEIDALILADEHPNIVRSADAATALVCIHSAGRAQLRLRALSCISLSVIPCMCCFLQICLPRACCLCISSCGRHSSWRIVHIQVLCYGGGPRVCVSGAGEVQGNPGRSNAGKQKLAYCMPACWKACRHGCRAVMRPGPLVDLRTASLHTC